MNGLAPDSLKFVVGWPWCLNFNQKNFLEIELSV